MSETPETDQTASHEGNWDTKALRMTAKARSLEQERDNARAEAERWRDHWRCARSMIVSTELPWEITRTHHQ